MIASFSSSKFSELEDSTQKLTVSQPLHLTVKYESDHWISRSGVWSSESRFSKISCVVSWPHLPQTSTIFLPVLPPDVIFAEWLICYPSMDSNIWIECISRPPVQKSRE